MTTHWHIACINWGHPDAPKAMSYAMRDGEMVAEAYHDTWTEAVERVGRFLARGAA